MEGSNIKYNSNANIKNNLKFILPSLLGIILFIVSLFIGEPKAILGGLILLIAFLVG